MAKVKTTFFCQSCGTQTAKWQGQCSSCKSWNTITEELVQKPDKKDWKTGTQNTTNRVSKPLRISEIDTTKTVRMDTSRWRAEQSFRGWDCSRVSNAFGG